MRTISRDEIIQVWNRLCDLDEKQSDTLAKQFLAEQPAVGIYLSVGLESLEESANSPIIELVLSCWHAMSQAANRALPQISPEQIEAAEEANERALEALEDISEIQWEQAVRGLMENYNQRELLGFGVEILMSGNEENPELAPESIGLDLIWLKTVLDCLDQQL